MIDSTDELRLFLAQHTADYWRSREVARESIDTLGYEEAQKVWRDFWGKGLFDED